MKRILILAALALSAFASNAEYIDLSQGGIQVAAAPCQYNNDFAICVLVIYEGNQYGVIIDEKGEAEIVLIEGDKAITLWTRDTI